MKKVRVFKTTIFFLFISFFFNCFQDKLSHAVTRSVDWSPLVSRLVADGFADEQIWLYFSHPDAEFDEMIMATKLKELLNSHKKNKSCDRQREIKALQRSYIKPAVISRARSYMEANKDELKNIADTYCVPQEIVVSVVLVETRLGKFLGGRKAFNALASMSLMSDLDKVRPYVRDGLLNQNNEEFAREACRQKAERAYVELKALLKYCALNNVDPLSIRGSIYGAIGICQFLPSNVFLYGVDADKDGKIDLFMNSDALHSVASYLRGNGWQCKMTRAKQKEIILTYNKSQIYANTVLGVADKLKVKKKPRREGA